MNRCTSRRGFGALAIGALTSLAAGLGRAFSQSSGAHRHPRLDARADEPLSEGANVTTYAFDAQARLISVCESTVPITKTLAYRDA